jgi:DNA polymerase I
MGSPSFAPRRWCLEGKPSAIGYHPAQVAGKNVVELTKASLMPWPTNGEGSMSTLIFDIETDGLLDKVTRIHCLVIKFLETGTVLKFGPDDGGVLPGLKLLEVADCIVGHNIVRFDIPVIQKFYPWFNPKGKVRDTLIMAKLIWPNLKALDAKAKVKDFPKQLTGRHSLEAWGWRLNAHKGTYGKTTDWKEFTPEMLEYCVQDVCGPTQALYNLILKKNPAEEAVQIEHDFTHVMHLQELHGFRFDEKAAHVLHATLVKRRLELQTELQKTFPGVVGGHEDS